MVGIGSVTGWPTNWEWSLPLVVLTMTIHRRGLGHGRRAALASDGAVQSLNGILLFGLTTAFLFAMIEEVWPRDRRQR